ncbi:TonB-dependent receptor [Methyloligella sp. 2.7D]|uniref:TonB-dependent receptor n=1 Tax=unclassified Methyloligella TaxID=2625955 RepID=UPI001FEE6FB0|nr:TonB-dependent receptor [Methyloligella sp. GL2]
MAQENATSSGQSAQIDQTAEEVMVPPVEVVQPPVPTPVPVYRPPTRSTASTGAPAAAPMPPEPVMTPLPSASQPAGMPSSVRNIAAQRAETSDTAALLNGIPGGATYSAGGVSGLPYLNGLAADRLTTQVGGMDLIAACANQMNPPLSYVAPSQVGSIEVYSALVPVSVGGDAVGGAIVVNPPAPVFAAAKQGIATSAEIGSYYRTNGDAYGGNASASAATQNFSIRYDGSYAASGNYSAGGSFKPAGPAFTQVPSVPVSIPWLRGNEVGSSAYEAQNHNVSVAARNRNHLLQFDLGIQNIPFQNYPNQRMDMTANNTLQANLRYTGEYDWGVLEAQAYHQNVRHEMDFGDDKQFYYQNMMTGIVAPGMPMKTKALNTGAKIKASIDVTDQHILRVGSEYQHYDYNDWWPPSPRNLPAGAMSMMAPDTFLNINDGKRDRFDVFAEWEAKWSNRWTTQLGVRSDTVMMDTGPVHGYNAMYDAAPLFPATTFNNADRSRTDQNWDVTAEAFYKPDERKTYSFGYARKARSPNLYERYTWSNVMMAMEMNGWFGDGNYYIGNLDLDPEVAHTISATADWHKPDDRAGLKVTPYYTYIQDYIGVRRCPVGVCGNSQAVRDSLTAKEGFVFLQFANQDASLFGVDLSGHMTLAEDTRYGTFTARGLLSYTYGENTELDDNLYHIMPVNSALALEQKLGRWTNTVETQLVGAKTKVSQVHNEVETGAYALLHLRTSYQGKRWRLDLGVENVFDTYYELPLGGLYLGQGATMSAGGVPWGIPVPGMGRSFYVAANMKF